MARYIKTPDEYWLDIPKKNNSIFMAGGITTPDWRSEVVEQLDDLDVVLIDPVRDDYN